MKRFKQLALVVTCCLLGHSGYSSALTTEQNEVVALIQKVYSYDPDTFENGEFNKNNQPFRIVRDSDGSLGGNFKPKLHCELYKNFFVDALIVPEKDRTWCKSIFVRYPTVRGEDLGSTTRDMPLPSPKIGTPVLHEDKAKVPVITGGNKDFAKGRTLYFLIKTQNGWRISNALLHDKWPEVKEDKCIGSFLRKPTPEERMELMPDCRDL